MSRAIVSLVVFLACYALFVVLPRRRSVVACAGAAALLLAGAVPWRDAVFEMINWNVMGLFFGTLVLAELFLLSRVPAVLAEWMVDRTASARGAMLALCALAGALSMFVENVAVVLLVAPVALSLAEKLRLNPTGLLIGIAVSSNLQGTATMVGDPPSMILAGFLKMGFLDFLFYQGRPGIFFAVQVGAAASLAVLAVLFRRHRQKVALVAVERPRSLVPSGLLVLLVVGLSLATVFDPDFRWFAAALTLLLAGVATAWYALGPRWEPVGRLYRSLDWDTTFFLMGVFVLVGGLSSSGWLDRLAGWLAGAGGSLPVAFVGITLLAVVVSGFVDNVPFLLAMIPVTQKVAVQVHGPDTVLLFGLLIGTCLGGNLTPIGASANVVAIGMLRRRGLAVSFGGFLRIGLPFTVAAVLASGVFTWLVWGR